jgi:hypothetical protein
MKGREVFSEEVLEEAKQKTDHVANMQKMAADILKMTNDFSKRIFDDAQLKPLYTSPNQKGLQDLLGTKGGKEFETMLGKFNGLVRDLHLTGKRLQKASRGLKIK